MSDHELKPRGLLADIAKQGLWKNNPALVQILGLCPTLAVTTSATNALGLGIATLAVLMMSNLAISLVRNWVPNEIRIPIYVMIIAALVTCVQLVMNAYLFELYQALGIFIALIVTNCIIIGRAESFANRNPPLLALFDGLMMGLGFTLVLLLLGSVREILGQGTLFAGADQLLGPWATHLKIVLFQADAGVLLAILPPGAFLALGFIIAAKNLVDARLSRRKAVLKPQVERARMTTL
ncbi:MAG: electron transport complex subunit E [Aeromonadaceae bacterium]|nr:electron transport complex subunit E [Aeromonadaceae bacterium]